MTQGTLAFIVRPSPSLNDRLERFFLARLGHWVQGEVLAKQFGYGGFRSRVSDLRRKRGYVIDVKVWRVSHTDGPHHRSSAYRCRGKA